MIEVATKDSVEMSLDSGCGLGGTLSVDSIPRSSTQKLRFVFAFHVGTVWHFDLAVFFPFGKGVWAPPKDKKGIERCTFKVLSCRK